MSLALQDKCNIEIFLSPEPLGATMVVWLTIQLVKQGSQLDPQLLQYVDETLVCGPVSICVCVCV